MTKAAIRGAGVVICVILLAGMAQPQNSQAEESLGDAAKEQQAEHPKQTNPTPKKVYRNRDVVTDQDSKDANASSSAAIDKGAVTGAGSAPQSKQTPTQETGPANAKNPPVQKTGSHLPATSIFDRKKDSSGDFILVPAGTQIEVNMLDSDVAMPVRIRFATPIPALSKVALNVFVVDEGYSNYDYAPELANFATLTSVTIGDVTYPVQSDTVPYATGEQIFTLSAPLRIKR